MSISVENKVVVDGDSLSKPTFILSSTGTSSLTLANQKTSGAVIDAEAAKNNITLAGDITKSITINGDVGKEIIKIKEGTELTGKSTMKLGANKDRVILDGIINKFIVDNGNDSSKDKVTISDLDNIQRKLKLNNFGEEDRLIIEGDVFKYQALEDPETRSQLKDFGIIVNLIDNN